MPLPRDSEDWRVKILQRQRDEARDWARRMRQRALKAEVAHRDMFDAHQKLHRRLASAERERDDANDAYREFYSRWAQSEREKRELERKLIIATERWKAWRTSCDKGQENYNKYKQQNAELVEALREMYDWEHWIEIPSEILVMIEAALAKAEG